MKRKIILILTFINLSLAFARAQTPPGNLEELLNRAEKATAHYSETFKNLSADETKVFEDYDKNGRLKETRRIKSIFIVYQSPNYKIAGELRNITEFNGKAVARQDKEIAEFFDKLAKADSILDELDRIRRDGIRFDGRSSAWGMTLWQETPLNLVRPFFEFQIVGSETIESRQTIIIEHRQTKPTLLVKFNPTSEDWKKEPNGRQYYARTSSDFRPFNPLIVGKIWLDAETARIWRNEFKVMIQPAQLSKPIVALELSYQYQPSEFSILVPKKFVVTTNKISGAGEKDLSVTKDRTMTFGYSKFSEFNSAVKDYRLDGKK